MAIQFQSASFANESETTFFHLLLPVATCSRVVLSQVCLIEWERMQNARKSSAAATLWRGKDLCFAEMVLHNPKVESQFLLPDTIVHRGTNRGLRWRRNVLILSQPKR